MDKSTFEKLIRTEAIISQNEAILLEDLLLAFPYCQAAHLLTAKDSKEKKSMLFPKKLRKASTYILDRQVLQYMLSKENLVNAKNKVETTPIEIQPIAEPTKNTIIEDIEATIKEIKEQKRLLSLNTIIPKPNIEPQTASSSIVRKKVEPKTDELLSETRLGDELTQTVSKSSVEMFLTYLNAHNISSTETIPADYNQIVIIEKFLEKEPKITRSIPNTIAEETVQDLSKTSTELKIELVTENYAQILIKQNKFDKAKEVYKKLMLKYPDKSAYFGAKLNEIENK